MQGTERSVQDAGERLAILPIAAGVGVPDFLAESLTEELAGHLRNHTTIKVLAQDSVSELARRKMSAVQIASAMRADLVLSGALQPLPGRYRLRFELLRGGDGLALWREDLILPEQRMQAFAAEVANRVSLRFGNHATLSAHEDEPYVTPEAFQLLWRARVDAQTLQRHPMHDALQRLQRAVELAPHWTKARTARMYLCVHQCACGFMSPQTEASIIRRCFEYPRRPADDEMLPALGWVYLHVDRNLRAASSAFQHAAHLPQSPAITRTRFLFALSRHSFAEAIDLMERTIVLDPYAAGLHARLAWAYHLAGHAVESIHRIEYALREFPQDEFTRLFAALILADGDRPERAVTIAEDLVRQCPYLDPALSAYAYALARAGRNEEAQALLEQIDWLSRERFVLRAFNPAVYVALGKYDMAMEELRVAERSRCPWFFSALADPHLEPLRKREDFQKLAHIYPQLQAQTARA